MSSWPKDPQTKFDLFLIGTRVRSLIHGSISVICEKTWPCISRVFDNCTLSGLLVNLESKRREFLFGFQDPTVCNTVIKVADFWVYRIWARTSPFPLSILEQSYVIADRIELENVSLLKYLAQHPSLWPLNVSVILAVITLIGSASLNYTDPLGRALVREGGDQDIWVWRGVGSFREVRLDHPFCIHSALFCCKAENCFIGKSN